MLGGVTQAASQFVERGGAGVAQAVLPHIRHEDAVSNGKRQPKRHRRRGATGTSTAATPALPDPGQWRFPIADSHGLLTNVFCQNVVAAVELCRPRPGRVLNKDVLRCIGAKCNLPMFHAIALRVEPGCTVLLFASGKAVVSGSKSREAMDCGTLTAVHILNQLGIGNFYVRNRRITNVVGTAYLPEGHGIDFNRVHRAIPLKCFIAPTFAGLFVLDLECNTNFILFKHGAIVASSRAMRQGGDPIDSMKLALKRLEAVMLRANAIRVMTGVVSKVGGALHHLRRTEQG